MLCPVTRGNHWMDKEPLISVPNSADRRPARYSALRGLVARHPVVAFLVLAFGFGWTNLIPILLAENGFGVLPIELPLTVVQTIGPPFWGWPFRPSW
jgi:hypothetical protein